MRLFLTDNKPWDTNYRLEGGQIIYKVSSPWKYVPRKTVIQRVQPAEKTENGFEPSQDVFADMAIIEYHLFIGSRTRFQFCGTDAKNIGMDELFKTRGGRYEKGEDQIFFGPDGKEYTWRMSERHCELYSKEKSTPIAYYRRGEQSILRKARPASLDITEENENLRDLIFLTFIYLERLRSDSDRPRTGYIVVGGS